MSKKYLILGFGVAMFLAAIAAFSGWYAVRRAGLNVRGQDTFVQTKKNVARLQKIKIKSPLDGEINIYEKDSGWYFKEAADYFVNTEQLTAFFKMVNNSVITSAIEASSAEITAAGLDDSRGVLVETFDSGGKLLDSVVLGNKLPDGDSYFAKRSGYPYIYTISSIGAFSGEAGAWMPFPLLEIPVNAIEKIKLDDVVLTLPVLEEYLPKSKELQKVLVSLAYLGYDGIAFAKDFAEDFPDIEAKTIEVATNIGLIYELKVYNIGEDDYWLSVQLKNDRIARKDVIPFVAENQKYFADRVFNLEPEQAQALYDIKAGDFMENSKVKVPEQ